jgi:hypothetical protein
LDGTINDELQMTQNEELMTSFEVLP